MITYRGDLVTCFKKASQDQIWTKKEREMLARIADLLIVDAKDYIRELKSKEFGNGRIFWVKGSSRYKFLVCATDGGFNIGRV